MDLYLGSAKSLNNHSTRSRNRNRVIVIPLVSPFSRSESSFIPFFLSSISHIHLLSLLLDWNSRCMSALYLYLSQTQSAESKANSEYWSKYHLKKPAGGHH